MGGRARGIPSLFVLTIHWLKVTLPTWPLPLHPRRKGLVHSYTAARTTSGGSPNPCLVAGPGPFHFLPASPLRTRETNVRRANQLQKRGPERSGTQTRDPRQPAAARPARAGRAPLPAAAPQAAALRLDRPGPPAEQQPPPDLGIPSPRSQASRRHPAAGYLAALRPARGEAPCHPEAERAGGGGGAAPTRGGRSQGRSSPSANHSGLSGFTRPSSSRSSRAA